MSVLQKVKGSPALAEGRKLSAQRTFLSDVFDLFGGAAAGNLSKWRYSVSNKNLLASGDQLWEDLVEYATSYYVSHCGEDVLSATQSQVRDYCGHTTMAVEFGPGKVTPARAAFLEAVIPQGIYCPVDISTKFLESSNVQLLEGKVKGINPIEADFTTDNITLIPSQKRIFLFLGATIGNLVGGPDQDPSDEVIRLLRHMRQQMQPSDSLVIGFDSNLNKDSVLACYNDERSHIFSSSILYRIEDELKPVGTYNPHNYKVEILWHPKYGQCAHTVVAQDNQQFTIAGRLFHVRAGQRLYLSNSYKFAEPTMLSYLGRAGFHDGKVVGAPNNPVKLALAKA